MLVKINMAHGAVTFYIEKASSSSDFIIEIFEHNTVEKIRSILFFPSISLVLYRES